MLSTDEKARAVCEAMGLHAGVAWVGMVIRGEREEGPGEVAGYAAVLRVGEVRGPGWWCAYIGLQPRFENALRQLDVHGGISYTTVYGIPGCIKRQRRAWMPEGFSWVGWDYAHQGDCTGLPGATTGRRWTLGEVVEAELKGAVAQLDLGAGYPARGIAGRVVSPEEWRHGR